MIINVTKKTVIARRPRAPLGFLARGRGMIGREFREFDAMVFYHCRGIHTLFMGFKIDVIFVNGENKVVSAREGLPPWRPFIYRADAISVIELPEGRVAEARVEVGDVIDLNAELTAVEKKKLREARPIVASPDTIIPIKGSEK